MLVAFYDILQQDASGSARLSRHAKVVICGRQVSIRMVDNPGKSQLIPAMMVIILLDLTNKVHVHVQGAAQTAVVHNTLYYSISHKTV